MPFYCEGGDPRAPRGVTSRTPCKGLARATATSSNSQAGELGNTTTHMLMCTCAGSSAKLLWRPCMRGERREGRRQHAVAAPPHRLTNRNFGAAENIRAAESGCAHACMASPGTRCVCSKSYKASRARPTPQPTSTRASPSRARTIAPSQDWFSVDSFRPFFTSRTDGWTGGRAGSLID